MPKIKDRRGVALENEDKPRPVFTVLPGGKRLDTKLKVPPPFHVCPHCHEREVAHEEAEKRKAARLNAESPIDEGARLQRAKSRAGRLLD
jgi:hypothetical protein